MQYVNIASAVLLGMTALSALAQVPSVQDMNAGARPGHEIGIGDSLPRSDKASNILSTATGTEIAPTLPSPRIGENAATHDYLVVARESLVAGRTGQAQQALEMAETRALDRWVPQGQTNTPSDNPLVLRIRDARQALGSGDSKQAVLLIDLALQN